MFVWFEELDALAMANINVKTEKSHCEAQPCEHRT